MNKLSKEVIEIISKFLVRIKQKFSSQKGQSTLEYALVTVVASVISAILIAVGKPLIVDLIAKAFGKIAGTL